MLLLCLTLVLLEYIAALKFKNQTENNGYAY